MQHTLIALLLDRPGALNRAVSLFRRRAFNIDSLSVATTETPGLSRMTVVVPREDVTQVARQLERLLDVIEVRDVTREHVVVHELCLVRLRHPGAHLGDLLRAARDGDAHVVEATADAVVVAIMGSPPAVSRCLDRLQPFGILELTRSGRIVMPASGSAGRVNAFGANRGESAA